MPATIGSNRHHKPTSAGLLASVALTLAFAAAPALAAKGGGGTPAPAPTPAPAQQAVLLTFDDFTAAVNGVHMPNGHGGFVWGDRWFAMLDVASGNNDLAVGSGLSMLIQRADGTPFYFDGADFWSRRGLDAVGDFYYVLYYRGQTVYNGLTARKGKLVFTGTPARLKPDYTGPIDAVAFAFDGNGLDWNHLAMDNFRFRVDVK